MSKAIYMSIDDVSQLQKDIILFIDWWVHIHKTPVPQREIVIEMKNKGVKDFTCVHALSTLINKGYIRKGFSLSNRTIYVQLRRI